MATPKPVLPQRATPTEAVITSVQWLFEPFWSGDRFMARLEDGRVTLTDAVGKPAGTELDEAADLLRAAIDAGAVLIDGVWTAQPSAEGVEPSRDARPAFVAIDLVELEGEPLAEVPYLERRRLLASVLAEGRRVRISPAVRQPVNAWLRAWRAQGFSRYVAKHVNSRYHPGEQAEDWLIMSLEPEPVPGVGRMFRLRPKKLRLIED